MLITRQTLMDKRAAILKIARRNGAQEVRVFGSVARGDNTPTSDLDILVHFEAGRTLMDHAGLIGDLEDFLGTKVDVVDADALRPRFRTVVEREALPL